MTKIMDIEELLKKMYAVDADIKDEWNSLRELMDEEYDKLSDADKKLLLVLMTCPPGKETVVIGKVGFANMGFDVDTNNSPDEFVRDFNSRVHGALSVFLTIFRESEILKDLFTFKRNKYLK